jgi:hypothetical protein
MWMKRKDKGPKNHVFIICFAFSLVSVVSKTTLSSLRVQKSHQTLNQDFQGSKGGKQRMATQDVLGDASGGQSFLAMHGYLFTCIPSSLLKRLGNLVSQGSIITPPS